MIIFDSLGGGTAPHGPSGPPKCSRKGCRADATVALLWNNPKIHTPERRKTWLACVDHAGWLENYLTERLLFKERLPLEDAVPGSSTQGE